MAKLGKKKFLLPTLCVFLFFVFAFFAIAEFNPVPKQTWPDNNELCSIDCQDFWARNDGSAYVVNTMYVGPTFLTHILPDGTIEDSNIFNLRGAGSPFSDFFSGAFSNDESILYIGGIFSTIYHQLDPDTLITTNRNNIAAVDSNTGSTTFFDPDISGDSVFALALSPDNSTLFAGGSFYQVNSNTTPVNRNNIAAFNANDGTSTAFNGDINGQVNAVLYGTLPSDRLYVGGNFTIVNQSGTPKSRSNFAILNPTTGVAFSPGLDFNGPVRSIALSPNNKTLYVAGDFTSVNPNGIGDVTRNHIAAFDAMSSYELTSFDPDLDGNVTDIMVSSDGSVIYVSGSFATVNQNTTPALRNHIASFNTSTSVVTSFNPSTESISSIFNFGLSSDTSVLYLATYDYSYKFSTDFTPPIISNIVASSTDTTVTITWDTDEIASSKVEYGESIVYGSETTETDINPRVTSHSVSLSGLNACTTYHFRVTSKDDYLNTATSTDQTFTTTGCPTGGGGVGSTGGGVVIIMPPVVNTGGGSSANTTPPPDTSPPDDGGDGNMPSEPTPSEIPDVLTTPTTPNTNNDNTPVGSGSGEAGDVPADVPTDQNFPNDNLPENVPDANAEPTINTVPDTGCGAGFFAGALCTIRDTYQMTLSAVSALSFDIKNFMATSNADALSKIIGLTGLVFATIFTILPIIFSTPLSFSEIVFLPYRLWSLLLSIFGLRKQNRPWGTVYDAVTKQPLDPVVVTLFDMSGKEISTSITDMDGRYGFLVASGTYNLTAGKTHYIFPSKKLLGKTRDEIYLDLYFGGTIEVKEEGQVITKNIPMDPENFDWNEFAKRDQKLMTFYSKRDIWISRISGALFSVGFFISTLAFVTNPTKYNVVIFALYILLYILREVGLKTRKSGRVRNASGAPLSFAVVRVFTAKTMTEIATRVCDKIGVYYCLVSNGDYVVTIEQKNPDESYTKVYTSGIIHVTKGFINEDFKV